MKRFVVLAIVAVLQIGCSKGPEALPEIQSFPVSAWDVINDQRFQLVFTSSVTGISYYVRPLADAELDLVPQDNLINSDALPLFYVAIKNDQIVEAPVNDRITLAYGLADEIGELAQLFDPPQSETFPGLEGAPAPLE